jgi:hypothetical protein
MQGGFFVDIKKEKLAIKGGTPVLSDPLPSSLAGDSGCG